MNQRTSPEVSNQEVQKAEQEEKTSGKWSRRSFLQAGSVGLSALAVSACTSSLGAMKKKLVVNNDQSNFHTYLTANNAYTQEVTVIIKAKVTLQSDMWIPKTMELIVHRGEGGTLGKIQLNGHRLKIQGTFQSNSFQVFEYINPTHIFGEHESVFFEGGSVEKVNVAWFGAKPITAQSSNDSTYPIQRAIDSSWKVRRVYIPTGKYKITDTIHLGRHNGNAFNAFPSYVLEGGGAASGLDSSILQYEKVTEEVSITNNGVTQTVTKVVNGTRPVINIQLVRSTVIRNISIFGFNKRAYIESTYNTVQEVPAEQTGQKRPELEHWLDNTNMTSRYSPFCAIAIDGYVRSQAVNGDYYPTSTERKLVYNFGGGSQKVLLERVYIADFGVGIAIAPGGAAQNDGHIIKECEVRNCGLGISIGSSQARAVLITNTDIYRSHTAITNAHNGEAQNSLFNINSNQYISCRNIYRLTPYYLGSCSITGDYAEDIVRIGTFGNLANLTVTSSISVSGCNYRLDNVKKISTLGALVAGNVALHFQGCTFSLGTKSELSLHPMTGPSSRITFESCTFICKEIIYNQNTTSFEPKIWLFPSMQPTLWNNVKGMIRFENSTIPYKSHGLLLSNELSVPLTSSNPIRYPLHWSTNSIRVSGDYYNGEELLQLKKTLHTPAHNTSLLFLPLGTPSQHPTESHSVLIQPHPGYPASSKIYKAGDRFLISIRYKGDDSAPISSDFQAPVITLDDEGNGELVWENGKIRASVPNTSISYRRDFELVPEKHSKGRYLYLYPRTDLLNPNNSQLYVILNGVVKGQFTQNSSIVPIMENANLLQVGDFINQEYVDTKARVKSIDLTSTPPTITMTTKATKTSQGPAHVPAIYVQGS